MSEDAISIPDKPRVIGRPFAPGNNANPSGRPKGSRNKLGEAFLEALHEDFKEHGKVAIESCRADKPDKYLKVIASLLPKQAEIRIDNYEHLDADQLRTALSSALRDLATFGIDISAGPGELTGPTIEGEPAVTVQAVQ